MSHQLVLIGCMALIGSFAHASSCGAAATSCEHTSAAVAISSEEAMFVSKLSESAIQVFNLMTIELRHEAVEAARKESLGADDAVEAVLKKHSLALVDGELKARSN